MTTYPRYSTLQIVIHWISAVLVLIALSLPLMRTLYTDWLGSGATVFMLHKSLGLLIFLITLWRVYLLITRGVPEVLAPNQKLMHLVSKSVQGIMYLTLFCSPISGFLMSSRPISVFTLFTLNPPSLSESVQNFFHSVHSISGILLLLMVLLHISAALYHHYWRKDNVLRAMLPSVNNN